PGRARVHEAVDGATGTPDHDGADQHPSCDTAPNSEASSPDLEGALPLRIGHLVPARDHVVEARAHHSAGNAPHGVAEDEIPVAAAPHPADSGEPHGPED